MSIATAITNAQTRVAAAYTAISAKGGTLPATQNLSNMPTAISSIPGEKVKYGATIDTFLPDVDSNGNLSRQSGNTSLVFSGVKNVNAFVLAYKVAYTQNVKHISFPDLVTITGDHALDHMCYISRVETAEFPELTTVSGAYALQNAFVSSSISNMSFTKLTTVSGLLAMAGMLQYCPVTTLRFDALNTISGMYAMQNMLNGDVQIEDVYYPALTNTSFGSSYTNQFSGMLNNTGSNKTHTLHFPSNLESTIQGLSGYPLFGGTSGYVVLAYDLPATN